LQNINIFFSSLRHQIWRRYYYFFNKDEVAESIKERKGECKRCGLCCQASIRCPKLFYDENDFAMCKIHDNKSDMCKMYPYNGRDFFPHLKEKCGFWYEE
jgi:Fe-S-cluster containining protein